MATVGGNILEALDEHISVWEGRSKVATPQHIGVYSYVWMSQSNLLVFFLPFVVLPNLDFIFFNIIDSSLSSFKKNTRRRTWYSLAAAKRYERG